METKSENPKFTASALRNVGGISYRQLNDWDSKGALPSQRGRGSGWRKFDPKQLFVILVIAEMRKQFGTPIEKLAGIQRFMLQDGTNHFATAVKMMRLGMAVLILTDFNDQFHMDADFAIGDLIQLGYCRYDRPQSYGLLLVNPLVNKILAALKEPMRLNISDTTYGALSDAQAATRTRDMAELEVLRLMRQPNISKIKVTQTNEKEVLLEIYENAESDGTVRKDQISPADHEKDRAALISRKLVKKVVKEAIGIIAVRLKG